MSADSNLPQSSDPRLFSGAEQPKAAAAPRVPLSSPDITQAEIDAVTAVLRTPHLSLGPELTAFEAELAPYHSVPHAVAVSSGTAGLHLALLTLGMGEGDEVIVPSFTFVAVANAVLQVRATPVFAEIDPVTLNLDPASVERAVTPRTRALLVVHTFGVMAEMDALQQIARRHALVLIEDACEAIGAQFGDPPNARRAGSFGDLAVFGFYPNKQLTTGEGGAVLARDPAHAARLRSLRNQGRKPDAGWLDHAEWATTTVSPIWPARWAGRSCSASARCSACARPPPSATTLFSEEFLSPASNFPRSPFPAAPSAGSSMWSGSRSRQIGTACRQPWPPAASPADATLPPSICSRPGAPIPAPAQTRSPLPNPSPGARSPCPSSTASPPASSRKWPSRFGKQSIRVRARSYGQGGCEAAF